MFNFFQAMPCFFTWKMQVHLPACVVIITSWAVCLLSVSHCAPPQREPYKSEQVDTLKARVIGGEIGSNEAERQVQELRQNISSASDSVALIAASALHRAGNELIDSTHFVEARSFFGAVLSIRRQILTDSNHIDILRTLHNIGYCYAMAERDYLTALDYYDRVDIPESKALLPLYVVNNTRKGVALWKAGQVNGGLKHFGTAFDTLALNPEPNTVGRFLADLLAGYSSCLREHGRLAEAIDVCREGMEKIGKGQLDDNPELLLALGNIWQDSLKNGKTLQEKSYAFQQADAYTGKALLLYQQDGAKWVRAGITAGNLGELYRRYATYGQGSDMYYRKAEDVLRKALASNRQGKTPKRHLSHLYMNLGEVYYDQHLQDSALAQYALALQNLVPDHQIFAPDALPEASKLKGETIEKLTLLSNYAQAYVARSFKNPEDLFHAARMYDCLFVYINHLRGELMSDEAKLELAAKSQDWLHNAFEGNMRLYRETRQVQHLERAFQISEQGKAFTLLEAARLRNASTQLPDVQKRERLLLAQADAADTEEKRSELDKSKRAYFKFLKDNYPGYYHLKYQGVNKTLAEISAVLDTNQALVAYFCQDAALYAFVLHEGRLLVDSFPVSSHALTRLADSFHQRLSTDYTVHRDSSGENAFCAEASHLYQLIFKGLEKFNLPERIVLVPDGPLNNIPFEAFLIQSGLQGIEAQAVHKNYLLFRHSFSYCFSANMLCEMSEYAAPASLQNKLAVFAPAGNEQNAKIETENIVSKVDAVHFPREQSTKQNFAGACLRYAYVHVATHGLVAKDPDRNYICFTDTSAAADTALFLKELYNRRLGQDLIAFSACETAIGQYRSGEGNMSLARGLAYAGVRSFITTLWKVPTEGKADLLPDFYDFMFNKKMPRDEAFSAAKRNFLEDKGHSRHPGNWAGLVLIGASTAPKMDHDDPWKYAFIILFALSGFFLGWRYYRTGIQK